MKTKLIIEIPPKHCLTILHDTSRLLDDLAHLHPTPEYVRGYAADLRRATKEIQKLYHREKLNAE
jgi:hypothetical protein